MLVIEECEKGVSELLNKEVERKKADEQYKPSMNNIANSNPQKEKPSVLRRALQEEQDSLQARLHNLKGLFSCRRRRAIEARLLEIEKELIKT